MKGAAY